MKFLIKLALLFLTTLTFIACGGGSSGGGGSAGGGETPPSTTTKLTIDDPAGNEGENIIFIVTSAQAITEQITFQYEATVDNKATNPAKISDLIGKLTGTSTIDANTTSTTISIAIADDLLRENEETFLVILSDLSPNDATFTDNEAIGTISANDDATGIVIISVANAEVSEASSSIKFKVTSAFPAPASGFSFEYEATVDSPFKSNSSASMESSASTDDFTAIKNTATIPADSTNAMISIIVATDDTIEPDETFRLLLTNPSSNATLDNLTSKGTILNDDLGEISDATAIIGDGAITLNWTNPKSNIFASAVIAYQESSTTAPTEKCSSGATSDVIENATSDTITGLTNGTAYSFRICSKSKSGSLSGGFILTNLIPDIDSDKDGFFDSNDVDDDNDGLIEIADATQFNNIRYNLAGTGSRTSTTPNNNPTGETRGCPNAGTGCNGYELTANIDLSGYSNWNPIGRSLALGNALEFTATFDGNNNRISNLTITGRTNNVGLFILPRNATIKNLKLTDVSIDGGGNVGALAAQATGTTTLSNIELIGDESQSNSNPEIKGTGASVGGLVGDFRGGTITDASSSLTIRGGADDVGGLVGRLVTGSIQNSNSSGSVSASGGADNVGGLVGRMDAIESNTRATISNSWASGNVSSTGDNNGKYGGLVGRMDSIESNTRATISNSWASGNVSSTGDNNDSYGGLVGAVSNNSSITQAWASGNVYSSNGGGNQHYGGLVGATESPTSHIRQVWAGGNVYSSSSNGMNLNYGGLLGIHTNGSIRQSWASGNVSNAGISAYGITYGGLVGTDINSGGQYIDGRNYQLDASAGNNLSLGSESFVLDSTTELARLSGDASGGNASYGTHSEWHAGFNNDPFTMFCNTNGDGTIDTNEKVASNSVWVMPPAANNVTTDTNEANQQASYYQIPAIRCIGDTKGKTPQEITTIRQENIDRQRRLFPRND